MADLLEQAKLRYCNGVPAENDLAAAFRADVGYLLQRLASAERAIEAAHWGSWSHKNTYLGTQSNDAITGGGKSVGSSATGCKPVSLESGGASPSLPTNQPSGEATK